MGHPQTGLDPVFWDNSNRMHQTAKVAVNYPFEVHQLRTLSNNNKQLVYGYYYECQEPEICILRTKPAEVEYSKYFLFTRWKLVKCSLNEKRTQLLILDGIMNLGRYITLSSKSINSETRLQRNVREKVGDEFMS